MDNFRTLIIIGFESEVMSMSKEPEGCDATVQTYLQGLQENVADDGRVSRHVGVVEEFAEWCRPFASSRHDITAQAAAFFLERFSQGETEPRGELEENDYDKPVLGFVSYARRMDRELVGLYTSEEQLWSRWAEANVNDPPIPPISHTRLHGSSQENLQAYLDRLETHSFGTRDHVYVLLLLETGGTVSILDLTLEQVDLEESVIRVPVSGSFIATDAGLLDEYVFRLSDRTEAAVHEYIREHRVPLSEDDAAGGGSSPLLTSQRGDTITLDGVRSSLQRTAQSILEESEEFATPMEPRSTSTLRQAGVYFPPSKLENTASAPPEVSYPRQGYFQLELS